MKKILLPILLIMMLAFSRTGVPGQSGREFQIGIHNINNIEMHFSNFGTFGQTEGGDAGLLWPKGTDHNYIYGAGTWFGTIVEGETLVTIGYGPSGGQFEYAPGLIGWSVSDPDAIIFMYPTPWPPTADRLPMAPQETKSHQDSWCVYNDEDIQYHMAGDTRPIGLEVYQTIYAWNLSTTADIIFLKFEVKNVTGQLAEYYPSGAVTLSDCWFGVCTDNDIGNEAGASANDIISGIVGQWYVIEGESLWVDNLAYQWQTEMEPGTPPWWPGAIGFDYLQSPYDLVEGEDKDNDGILDQYERDSAYIWNNYFGLWDADQDGTPDFRDPSQIPQIGMKTFKRFTLDLEPSEDNERYVCMAGYNFKTLVFDPFGDTLPPAPDDQRFVQCSGPFELMPDSSVIVMVGVILAEWELAQGRPDTALVLVDVTAQFIYDQNWLLPGPPPPPTLTCIPGDAQITLVWECVADPTSATYDALLAADPYYEVVGWDSVNNQPYSPALYDSFYVKYDFQGYGIWKSRDGMDWTLLERYDIYDDIVFDDTITGIYAENTGLLHYYIDSDVRNGFTYYYTVTSFDYNWTKILDTLGNWYGRPIWFEGGGLGVTSAPRRDPANYQSGEINVEVLKGNPILGDSNITTVITHPMEMTDDLFYLDFGPIVYDDGDPLYSAVFTDEDGNTLAEVIATLAPGDVTFSEFGTRNGISITAILQREDIPATESIFDRIETSNNYFVSIDSTISAIDSTVTPWDTTWIEDSLFIEDHIGPVTSQANWAYRGDDYEVHWIKAYGSNEVNSVIVIDKQVGDTIPFKPYRENSATDSLAYGWCFRTLLGSDSTLVYGTIPTGTRNLYMCGGKFKLKRAGQLAPGDPRPSENDVWTVYANPDYMPAPANARLQITPTPAAYGTEQVELNVKVTPNPFLIHNEWQQTFRERRLKFINLPSDCIIRIFNLNGELVRTIRHQHTLEPAQGEQEVMGSAGGDEWWDLLSDNRQLIASGVYIFHIQSEVGEQVGKFVVIR